MRFLARVDIDTCVQYINFYKINGKCPGLMSKDEREKNLARRYMQILIEQCKPNQYF